MKEEKGRRGIHYVRLPAAILGLIGMAVALRGPMPGFACTSTSDPQAGHYFAIVLFVTDSQASTLSTWQ